MRCDAPGGRSKHALLLAAGIICAMAAFCGASTPVAAQDAESSAADEEAKAHFQSGTLYFDRGDYEDAEREFRAAYELSERPTLLYNIYLALERLGRYEEAADTLERYLQDSEEVPNRSSLESRLARLRERAESNRGEGEGVEPEATPYDGVPSEAEPEDQRLMPVPAWVAFGVGAAGLLTFAVAGGMALGEDSDLAGSCGEDSGRSCSAQDVARLERLTRTADVGLALGLVGAATGVVLLFVLGSEDVERAEAAVSLDPWVGPRGGGASARVRF